MNRGQDPLVSVIIPHQGNDDRLLLCISALRLQTLPAREVEIIIVLNERKERTLGFDLKENETCIWEPNYYSYNARNRGIQAAHGSIVALTDSDTVPSLHWLEHAARHVESGAQLIAGQVTLSYQTRPLSAAASYEKLYAFDQEKNVRFGRSTTANLVGRSELFTNFTFNVTAETGEDFRWTTAATARGTKLIYAEDVEVSHPARESLRDLLDKAKRVSRKATGSLSGGMKTVPAFRHYLSVHLFPPSRSKRKECSPRELLLATATSLLLQAAKLWFFLRSR